MNIPVLKTFLNKLETDYNKKVEITISLKLTMSVYKHDLDFRTMKGTLKQIHKSIQNLKLQCCEPSVPRVYP